jgi:hypothetical protein
VARSRAGLARAASEKLNATTVMKTIKPAVRSTEEATAAGTASAARDNRSAKFRQSGLAEKLSKTVDPNNTDITATTPGRTGSDGR